MLDSLLLEQGITVLVQTVAIETARDDVSLFETFCDFLQIS
jgi:hypothetical protein